MVCGKVVCDHIIRIVIMSCIILLVSVRESLHALLPCTIVVVAKCSWQARRSQACYYIGLVVDWIIMMMNRD